MRRVKQLSVLLLTLVIAACATFASLRIAVPGAGASAAASGDPGPAMHRSFREASDIVLATCMGVYKSAAGAQLSRYRVDTVYAGSIAKGAQLSLPGKANPGQSYLLYLGEGGGADYAEDNAGYVCVTEEPIAVKEGIASIGGVSCSLSAILDDIEKQRSVLTIPAQSFYYYDVSELLAACDEVIIGRVVSVDGPVATQCRSDEKGESVISTTEQTFVTVQVLNGMGGRHNYGDSIKIALSPARTQSVINATDLNPVSFYATPRPPEEGVCYVFMLLRSADSKSDCLFAVNPYQGFVELDGDELIHPYFNHAFDDLYDLNELAAILRKVQGL